jgi:hypothetical protein
MDNGTPTTTPTTPTTPAPATQPVTPEERREAARTAILARREAALAGIKAALEQRGHVAAAQMTTGFGQTWDGIFIHLEISEDTATGGWIGRSRGTGRLRIKFGDYGDVRQFPEPKKGFDIEKLAGEISVHIQCQTRARALREERAVRYNVNKVVAAQINTDLGLKDYSPRAVVDGTTGALVVQVSTGCSEVQARAILAAVKQILAAAPADEIPLGL